MRIFLAEASRMSAIPPTFDEASTRGLLEARKGYDIHTFSNGTHWDGWADSNCYDCFFYDMEASGGMCAFESAAFLGMVSPSLALLFGWTLNPEYADHVNKGDPPDSRRHGWDEPQQCAFFRRRTNDDGEDNSPPPATDPLQLVLIADPSEDAATITAVVEALECVA